MSGKPPSDRTRVRRLPELGVYERNAIDAILDEALICHVAYIDAEGSPRLIPTIHVRVGDSLYFHGSSASQTLRALRGGARVAVAATILDGIRFARSMFEHSMNYRSVIVYGTTRSVTDPLELEVVARSITDHVAPGRAAEARMPNPTELKQTSFLAVSLDECSAKVSTGQATDPEEDYSMDVWAGILPLGISVGTPVADPLLKPGVQVPGYISDYRR